MDHFKIIKNRFELECLLGKTSFNLDDIQKVLADTELIVKNNPDKNLNPIKNKFADIVSKINRTEKIKNVIYYMVDDTTYMIYHLNKKSFCVNHKELWSIFETEFKLSDDEISELLKNMLSEHYNYVVNSVISTNMLFKILFS